jgi:hypothetical protein
MKRCFRPQRGGAEEGPRNRPGGPPAADAIPGVTEAVPNVQVAQHAVEGRARASDRCWFAFSMMSARDGSRRKLCWNDSDALQRHQLI